MLKEKVMGLITEAFDECESEVRRLLYGTNRTNHDDSLELMDKLETFCILSYDSGGEKTADLTVSAGITEVDAFEDVYTINTSVVLTVRRDGIIKEATAWFDVEAVELPEWLINADEERITLIDSVGGK